MAPAADTVLIKLGDPPVTQALAPAQAAALVAGLLAQGKPGPAASAALQFARQAPASAVAQALAARMLYEVGELRAARAYVERALGLGHRAAEVLHLKSRLCMELGEAAEALRAIEEILARAPDNAFYHCIYGQQRLKAGDVEGARASLREALRLNPREIAAFATLSRLPGGEMPEHSRYVEQLLESGQLPAEEQLRAHYALALQFERAGDDERQFVHLRAMNAKKRAALAFDAARCREQTERMIGHYSAAHLAAAAPAPPGPPLIFVYGFPRSGTSLVEQVLAGHPQVLAAGETSAFLQAVMAEAGAARGEDALAAFVDLRDPRVVARIRQGYLARMPQVGQGQWVTDKSPENFMLAGLIRAVFPEARLVRVRRHPVATGYSCYKQLFAGAAVPYAYSLEDIASRYTDYRRMNRHWEAVLPGQVFTLDYERLVTAPEAAVRELLAHCGLAWEAACLDVAATRRAVNTASSAQVREGIHARSLDRWRRYEHFLGPLRGLVSAAAGLGLPLAPVLGDWLQVGVPC